MMLSERVRVIWSDVILEVQKGWNWVICTSENQYQTSIWHIINLNCYMGSENKIWKFLISMIKKLESQTQTTVCYTKNKY